MGGVLAYTANGRDFKNAQRQLEELPCLAPKEREVVTGYLALSKIGDLDELSVKMLISYREYICSRYPEGGRAKHYAALLESVALSHLKPYYTDLCSKIDEVLPEEHLRALKNKLKMFLMLMHVKDIRQITYHHRRAYKQYLSESGCANLSSYVKLLDRIKLKAIEEENAGSFRKEYRLSYMDDVIFLGYHPDFKAAGEFYYLRDKEELVFDFSLPAPEKIKRQIFSMLNHVLSLKMKRKNRREMYIVPLKKLYLYAADARIEDLEMLSESQVEGFRKSMEGKAGTKTKIYMQIVYSVRKYLFLSAADTNWDANVWFLERFHFKNDRVNPADVAETFRFDQIVLDRNRALMKQYMKYQIGIGSRALATVLSLYGSIMPFLRFCDSEGILIPDVTSKEMDKYTALLEMRETKDATFNKSIRAVGDFYRYLASREVVIKAPFETGYYKKKTIYSHKDRTVSVENQMSLLTNLKHFPQPLRLMFLNIWASGIRVNEACTITGGAYSFDGQDAFLTVTQYKMGSEKKIPIPKALYDLMVRYIHDMKTGSDEYVFKNKRGGAYQASTFRRQVQVLCERYDIGDESFVFRPHDFRHLVATELFDAGASLQAIREYHGHRDESMTKQYIDYMPRKQDKANREYFQKNRHLGEE